MKSWVRACLPGAAIVVISFAAGEAVRGAEKEPAKIRFKRTQLDAKFRSEGAAVGDFNHDGKLDISAGSVYYAAPDWKMHVVAEKAEEYDPHDYSHSFCNFADDLNGDGWTDLLVVDFPGQQTWWFEKPQSAGRRLEAARRHARDEQRKPALPGRRRRRPSRVGSSASSPDAKNPDGPDRQMGIARRGADPFAAVDDRRPSRPRPRPGTVKYRRTGWAWAT